MQTHKNTLLKNRVRRFGEQINTGSVDSILASLFRKILTELNINTTRFNSIMEQHLISKQAAIPQNTKERSSARGNLKKELLKETMTWKVFCRGLRFLHVPKITLTITLHHTVKQPTIHTMLINLGDEHDGYDLTTEEDDESD